MVNNTNIKKVKNMMLMMVSYVMAVGVIITANTSIMYDSTIGLPSIVYIEKYAKICFLIALLFLTLRLKMNLKKNNIFKAVIVLLSILAFYVMTDYEETKDLFELLYILLLISLVVYFLVCGNAYLFWNAFINVVLILAVISLFFYLFGSILKVIPPSGITDVNWGVWGKGAKNFYYFYYESQIFRTGQERVPDIVRNCGFYVEGPMFNYVLCIALGAVLFLKEEKRKYRVIQCLILCITILTTLCTLGQIYLVFAFGAFALENPRIKKFISHNKRNLVILAILMVVIFTGISLSKLLSKSGAGSLNVRADHILTCLRIWRRNKFFGVGFLNPEILLSSNNTGGMSIGLPYMFASGGIALGAAIFVPFIHNTIDGFRRKYYKQFYFEVLFVLLNIFTINFARPIFILGLAYMISCCFPTESKEMVSFVDS